MLVNDENTLANHPIQSYDYCSKMRRERRKLKGIVKMKAVNIKLSLAENVKYFVNIANKYPYDLDLRVGRHVVDGKSILGIFSLDLSKPITLEVYADHCDDLMEELKPFIIG